MELLNGENAYGGAVYRLCTILEPIEGLGMQEAATIRGKLLESWGSIEAAVTSDPVASGWDGVMVKDSTVGSEEHEGLMAVYPEMDVSFHGIRGSAKAYITVCRPPRHSKVWLRVNYVSGELGAQHSHSLDGGYLKRFFDDVDGRVREKGMQVFLNVYRQVVERILHKDLRQVNTVRILTAAADLGSVAKKLQEKSFSMGDCFSDREQYERLWPLLFLTYGTSEPTRQDYESTSEKYMWMSVMSRGEEGASMVGLYSGHQEGDEGRFVGAVHVAEHDPQRRITVAREFSRRLISDIAPQI